MVAETQVSEHVWGSVMEGGEWAGDEMDKKLTYYKKRMKMTLENNSILNMFVLGSGIKGPSYNIRGKMRINKRNNVISLLDLLSDAKGSWF